MKFSEYHYSKVACRPIACLSQCDFRFVRVTVGPVGNTSCYCCILQLHYVANFDLWFYLSSDSDIDNSGDMFLWLEEIIVIILSRKLLYFCHCVNLLFYRENLHVLQTVCLFLWRLDNCRLLNFTCPIFVSRRPGECPRDVWGGHPVIHGWLVLLVWPPCAEYRITERRHRFRSSVETEAVTGPHYHVFTNTEKESSFFLFTKLLLLTEWLELTAGVLDEFKGCSKYGSTLYFGEVYYSGWSKQKSNGPSRWSVSSRICPNALYVLLQFVSDVWISRTLEEMMHIFNSIIVLT